MDGSIGSLASFLLSRLSLMHLLCRAFTGNGTTSYYRHHPWLNAHPSNAISPVAESHTREVRVSQQPFLSSLQDCLHPVFCLLFIDGQLCSCMESLSPANYRIARLGSSPESCRVAHAQGTERRAVPACGEQNKTGGDSPGLAQVMDVLLG